MTALVLDEVDPYARDYFMRCDLCEHSHLDDVVARCPERLMYRLAQDAGLVVCDLCLDGYLKERDSAANAG